MAIKKLSTGSYQLKIYIPSEIRKKLGTGEYYVKRYKTRKDAKNAELEIKLKISDLRSGREVRMNPEDIAFKEFYDNYWLEAYKAGQTTNTHTPPVISTQFQTENLFRLHLLPMFGKYSLKYLMSNKQLVLNKLTSKANEYVNFKIIRSYTNSVFDWAEELEFIEGNRLKKSISRIKPVRKVQVQREKNEEDLYLNEQELSQWLTTIEEDFQNGDLSLMDYTLFYTTFLLSDRKSETYALQWKHIDFEKSQIQLIQALDRYGDTKATKGNKKTIFAISADLLQLLQSWKKQQRQELAKLGIITNPEQFVFTYIDTKGNVNKPLHADYLNNKMRTVKNRHPHLTHVTPHKLRHTGATLAKQAGMSLEAISEALTHSDTATTQIYVNTSNVIPMAVGEVALNSLKL